MLTWLDNKDVYAYVSPITFPSGFIYYKYIQY